MIFRHRLFRNTARQQSWLHHFSNLLAKATGSFRISRPEIVKAGEN